MKTFEKFIEENYKGFNFISIASEAILPGVILNSDDRIIDNLNRIFPDQQSIKWQNKIIKANMPNHIISGERKLDFGVTLLGLLSLKVGTEKNYSISFEFNDVKEIVFDTQNGGVYENEIRNMIMLLKKSNRDTWKSILHENVVMEVVIVKKVTIEIKQNGKLMGEIDIQNIKNDLSINGSYTWNTLGKMVIENEQNLPFGVLDFQIKRLM
ncbi:hypothetical protein [Flavobacterium sp.]|uniref:hypothetical protein n=1 Tax=Flavobacterium sp. TaxID=239 RepID=UPI0037522C31